jgi:3-oxoacyl-[acyl-carrier-protein] synthase-3
MNHSVPDATVHLLRRLHEVNQSLGGEATNLADPNVRFADAVDSMAMLEFLAVVADDYRVTTRALEDCVGRQFGTVAELATRLHAAGWVPFGSQAGPGASPQVIQGTPSEQLCRSWLAATAAQLPDTTQSAASINEALHRPAGWLERHAGIEQRRIWAEQDPLTAGAEAGRVCLERAGLQPREIGALLVTSEAPPLLTGLAAALHHHLRLAPAARALEIGGACTGFLTALWTGQVLLPQTGPVLVLALEAHTRYLHLEPSPAGENAALFGDGAAACLLCAEPRGPDALPLMPVLLGAEGSDPSLLQVAPSSGGVTLHMRRMLLASRAVEAMAQSAKEVAGKHGFDIHQVTAILAHGGNGRLPGLLARKLGLPPERVWSEARRTGNLGSASLPVAWASRQPWPDGPIIWTAVGAGLTWGAVMVVPHA